MTYADINGDLIVIPIIEAKRWELHIDGPCLQQCHNREMDVRVLTSFQLQ